MAALPRPQHGRGRAAGALGVRRLLVDPEPQREADDVAAAGALAQQGDGGIDAARHRDGDPAVGVRERKRPLGGVAERRVQRVERDRGALPGAAVEPELLARSRRATRARRPGTAVPWLRRQAQAAAAVACAQAAAPKRAVGDRPVRRRARA